MIQSIQKKVFIMPSQVQPDLAHEITFKSIHLTELKFENQTNEATVGPASKIYGRLNLEIKPKEQKNSLRQIVVGIKNVGPKQLIHSERKIIGKRLEGFMSVDFNDKVYESYQKYPKSFVIEAPDNPGLYELEVCLVELEGSSIENPGVINGFYNLSSKDLEMLQSENSIDQLWNMQDQNCKISLGLIRVI